jgi:hypothetical protein
MSLGGNLGSGGFYGGSGNLGPAGPYGAWPGCGCSTFVIIMGIFLMVFGGCLRGVGF